MYNIIATERKSIVDTDSLIERWQAGDERAAEALYNQHRGATFGLAFALLDDAADAEEVAQDALTYALTHIDRYDRQKARFATWLHTITVSRCRNKRRRRFLPSLSLLTLLKRGGDAPDPMPGPFGWLKIREAADKQAIERS